MGLSFACHTRGIAPVEVFSGSSSVRDAEKGDDVIKINVQEALTGPDGFAVRLVPVCSEAGEDPEPGKTVGHALDRFLGTWTAEEEAELLGAVEVFERIDESFWA
jgi:hypothetical protein